MAHTEWCTLPNIVGKTTRHENMCFYETNRIDLSVKTEVKTLRCSRIRMEAVKIPIRFVCRENHIVASRRTRLSGNLGCRQGVQWAA